jgi:hypothetical protein
MSLRSFEEKVVIALGVKRRIEIDKVNGLTRDMLTHNVEIIPEVEFLHDTKITTSCILLLEKDEKVLFSL